MQRGRAWWLRVLAALVVTGAWQSAARAASDGGTCVPTNCQAIGSNCGNASDECGGTLFCGTCSGGKVCSALSGGVCVVPDSGAGFGDGGCVPASCGDQGFNCGVAGDGCGNELQCGTCGAGEVCGGGGFDVCGAPSSGSGSLSGSASVSGSGSVSASASGSVSGSASVSSSASGTASAASSASASAGTSSGGSSSSSVATTTAASTSTSCTPPMAMCGDGCCVVDPLPSNTPGSSGHSSSVSSVGSTRKFAATSGSAAFQGADGGIGLGDDQAVSASCSCRTGRTAGWDGAALGASLACFGAFVARRKRHAPDPRRGSSYGVPTSGSPAQSRASSASRTT